LRTPYRSVGAGLWVGSSRSPNAFDTIASGPLASPAIANR
jgi:hypothetical protein